jgi:OFA family oxalate/formate antiporter-like MFS transporter
MSVDHGAGERPVRNLGWRVTFAGLGINLALGILYTWSVISKAVPADWGWSEQDKSWPYSIACLVFSVVMVPAGRLQDKISPRIVATIGGVLVGLGMIVASQTTTCLGYILGFGVLAGAGFGFGYAAATPPAIKWFPAAKTGTIAGIVVAGFGLAGVYASPLAATLIGVIGLPQTMLCLGIAFLIIVGVLAQLLTPPPKGYVPPSAIPAAKNAALKKEDFSPNEILKTSQFYLLWFLYACGAGAGLMIIAKLAIIGKEQADIVQGFILVASCAVGNGAGRIIAGFVSDRIGRRQTMCICFLIQAVLMILLSMAVQQNVLTTIPAMVVLSALIGANYGANLSLFPSITKDFFGLKNFGMNYGLVFTAWGAGGFVLALLAGRIRDTYHVYTYAYYAAAGLLLLAAAVSFALKPPVHHQAVEEDASPATASKPPAAVSAGRRKGLQQDGPARA